jgi:competence protein ComEA
MAARGGWLLLLLILGLTYYDLGRLSSSHEERPALRLSVKPGTQILLRDSSGKLDGIHQISDVLQLISVINMADLSLSDSVRREFLEKQDLCCGKMLKLQVVGGIVVAAEFGWMPAATRIVLGIPLDVNRMSESDWQDLPGIGPSLASAIANDRHKNGDFGSLNELKRVKGVGLKRIEGWKTFFDGH